jgi:pyridoxamine 5'-phosphate oxidase
MKITDLSQQIALLRREYISQPLDEASVLSNPIGQFQAWFQDIIEAQQIDPEAMTLSTLDEHSQISARIVLLKNCDERGFIFYTNYESRKGRNIEIHPQVALTFYWPVLHRQVRIEGVTTKVSAEESSIYFNSRPRGSQLGAWGSPQSDRLPDRASLEARLAETEARFADQPISRPPFWGGYLVAPTAIEFWQGRENRLHDRILYSRRGEEWVIERLAP